MLHVFGRVDVPSKSAADQSFVNGSFVFPTDYSYRMSWFNMAQWWTDNIAWANSSNLARISWVSCLPYSQASGGGKSNAVNQTAVSEGEITHLASGTTKTTQVNWQLPRWSQIIYGDSGGTADPTVFFQAPNLSASLDGASTFYLNAAFHIYDLEQVHNFPVNAPFTAAIV